MYKFLPYMTNDYSVGLLNPEVNDIYHSAYGAISESLEKFVTPVINIFPFIKKTEIRVLDICYGIGYNTRVFINEARKKSYDLKIKIDCVDTDKILMELSPFILSEISFWDRLISKNKLIKNAKKYEEAKKIIECKKKSKNYKISKSVQEILLKNLILSFGIDFLSEESKKILNNHEYNEFFDKDILDFYKFLLKKEVYLHQNKNKSAFVHNIYYQYVSSRNKCSTNIEKNYTVNFHVDDVRKYLLKNEIKYDIIFLDGFTPNKCPCIWSVDIFKELYNHLDDDGILVTYNKSAPVRKAMLDNNFFIGNTISDKKKIIGTIASKNILNIKNRLSEYDLGLLNTKAGIPYRDVNLSLDNNIIKINRENEVAESTLISSSQYIKGSKK